MQRLCANDLFGNQTCWDLLGTVAGRMNLRWQEKGESSRLRLTGDEKEKKEEEEEEVQKKAQRDANALATAAEPAVLLLYCCTRQVLQLLPLPQDAVRAAASPSGMDGAGEETAAGATVSEAVLASGRWAVDALSSGVVHQLHELCGHLMDGGRSVLLTGMAGEP